MLHFGACRVDDVLFSVCKLFAKCIFCSRSFSPSWFYSCNRDKKMSCARGSLVSPLTEVNERASHPFLGEGDTL